MQERLYMTGNNGDAAMIQDKTQKTYVRPDNTAVLTCPHCGRQKAVNVESYRGSKSHLKVKCACKKTFSVNLEFRKRVRKRTNLRGTYVNHNQNGKRGNIVVKNISVSGLEFSSLDVHTFKVDDELTVEFTLDDEHRSHITKDVVVRAVRETSVGCEFERGGEFSFDGPLGFYIMS
jgi:hypothetical protein